MELNSKCQKSMMEYIEDNNIMGSSKYSHGLELRSVNKSSILTALLDLGYTEEDILYTYLYLYKNRFIETDGNSHEIVTDIAREGHEYLAQIREKQQTK